jgi:hypothetical protein
VKKEGKKHWWVKEGWGMKVRKIGVEGRWRKKDRKEGRKVKRE